MPRPGPRSSPRRTERLRTFTVFVITGAVLVGLGLLIPGLVPTPLRSLVGAGPKPLGHAPVVQVAGPHAFLEHQPDEPTVPVTWDPCRPIRYEVNLHSAPAGALGMVAAAVRDVSGATGLRFSYVGRTARRPQWDAPYLPHVLTHDAPVLISWATSREVPQLAGAVAGIGGAVAIAPDAGLRRYVTGGVTLDADAYARFARQPQGRPEERAILLHELGHLVGLAHVADRDELMNAKYVGVRDYAAGDLQGLAELGRGHCF